MILELDSGNTRIKWRLLSDSGDPRARGVVLPEDLRDAAFAQHLQEHTQVVRRIRASNTAAPEVAAAIDEWAQRCWQCRVEYAVAVPRLGEVVNGYHDAAQLGVDRWLGIVAAWQRCQQSCCVCDCGSAITFDCITGNGRHEGGYILPGLAMMRRALGRDTHALNIALREEPMQSQPGKNTAQAIQRGTLLTVAALLNNLRAAHQHRHGIEPHFFLTGGDAAAITPLLSFPVQETPDLVLEGLRWALP